MSARARVLHVLPSFDMGGLGSLALTMIRAWPDESAEHAVIAPRYAMTKESLKLVFETEPRVGSERAVSLFRNIMSPMGYVDDLMRLAAALGPFETVISYNVSDIVWTAMAVRRAGFQNKPILQHVGTILPLEARAQCSSWLTSPFCDDVLYVSASEAVRKRVVEFECPPARLGPVVWNGVDLGKYREARAVWAHAETPDDHLRFGFTGRMEMTDKDWPTLIQAFNQLPLATAAHTRLSIAGDGRARTELQKMAEPAGPRISFLGSLPPDDIPDFLAGLDVFVMPAQIIEGMSMALVEAFASGCAIIATDVPANREVLGGGEYGRLVAGPGNVKALVDTIVEVAESPALLKLLHERAITRAEAFSASRMASEYAALSAS